MPVCDVCGEDNYYEEDGLFFCTVCNTQSQSMVVMELDDTYGLNQRPSGAIQEIRGEKQTRKGRSEYEAGRPWTRYEAYQLILQAQADALIAQGAHPSVKEVIQRLYFAYLSKLEVAFVGENKTCLLPKGLERSKHTGWHRELHRGGMDHPEINPKAMKRSTAKSQCNTRNVDSVQEAALEGESFYEGDNPLDDTADSDDWDSSALPLPLLIESDFSTDDGEGVEEERSDARKVETRGSMPRAKSYRLGKQGVLFDIRYMNLRKTLSFLYAACLFTSPWITVSDILRWVSDASLPYLETTHLLPSDIKLSTFDHHLFRPSVVSSHLLRLAAGCLLRFLDIRQLPQFLLKDIAIRYTLALDLPEAMVACVVAVMRRCPVECSTELKKDDYHCKTLPDVDAICAAYILVTLKAIFGLDDHRERLLSDYTKEVQKKVDVQLFDWLQWQWHATHKYLYGPGKVPSALRVGGTERDTVEMLCQTFESAQYKDQNYSHFKLYHKQRKARVATFKQENREMLKRSASVLEERWKNRDVTATRMRADEHCRQSQDGKPHREQEGLSIQDQTVQFRTSSIDHLLYAEDFLQQHLQQLGETSTEGQRTVKSDAMHQILATQTQRTARSASSETECSSTVSASGDCSSSSISASDLMVTRVRKRKRSSDRDCVYDESTDIDSDHNESGDMDSTSDKGVMKTDTVKNCQPADEIRRILQMHSNVSGDYWVCAQEKRQEAYSCRPYSEWWRDQPSSYRWLLHVLSCLVCCPHSSIQRKVCHIEQALIRSRH